MRILLVGKDDEQAQIINRVLTASTSPTFQVQRASNAWDAQRRAADGPYDVLVLDDRLTDTDGETLLGRLRDSGVRAPALLLTSGGWDELAARSPQTGVDDCLPRTEGSNGNALVRAVVAMLAHRAMNNDLATAREQAARTAAELAELTHGLATPLGVIAGMAQVLLDDDYGLNDDGRLCLEDVLHAATTACDLLKATDMATSGPVAGAGTAGGAGVATAPPGASDDEAEPAAGRKMVLIADDDPATRRLVSITLASDQYSVLQAADGKEAWRMIRDHHPAVAILDWQMPIYSGLELTDVIKSDPQVWGMTVIMLTGRTAEADRRAGAQARADLYLTKPFSPQELLAAVEQALGIK